MSKSIENSIIDYREWKTPLIAIVVYVFLFIISQLLNLPFLINISVATFFLIILIKYILITRIIVVTKPVFISIILLILPLVFLPFNNDYIIISSLFKHFGMFLIFIVVSNLRYKPIYNSKYRHYFVMLVVLLLFLSIISNNYFVQIGNARLSGLFANPNNLSLIALTLLIFIKSSDSTKFELTVNLIIVGILFLTATLGSIIAYIVGIIIRFKNRKYLLTLLSVVLFIMIASSFISSRFINQFQVIINNFDYITSNTQIDYGSLSENYGGDALSGIWRIATWVRTILFFINQDFINIIGGSGIGSCITKLGYLPHNDILRILFEQGILGIMLFAMLYLILFKKIDKNYKYILIIFLLYSITENIIDNFIFVILFTFFIGSSNNQKNNSIREK